MSKLDQNMEQLEHALAVALGERVLARSKQLCPVKTGKLKSTATLTVEGNTASISYHTHYAVTVHELAGFSQGYKWIYRAAMELGNTIRGGG